MEGVKKFHEDGKGICIWSDNSPFIKHGNLVLQELLGVSENSWKFLIVVGTIDRKYSRIYYLESGRWRQIWRVCQASFDNWHCQFT